MNKETLNLKNKFEELKKKFLEKKMMKLSRNVIIF